MQSARDAARQYLQQLGFRVMGSHQPARRAQPALHFLPAFSNKVHRYKQSDGTTTVNLYALGGEGKTAYFGRVFINAAGVYKQTFRRKAWAPHICNCGGRALRYCAKCGVEQSVVKKGGRNSSANAQDPTKRP